MDNQSCRWKFAYQLTLRWGNYPGRPCSREEWGGDGVSQRIIRALRSVKGKQKGEYEGDTNMKKAWPHVAVFEDRNITP